MCFDLFLSFLYSFLFYFSFRYCIPSPESCLFMLVIGLSYLCIISDLFQILKKYTKEIYYIVFIVVNNKNTGDVPFFVKNTSKMYLY